MKQTLAVFKGLFRVYVALIIYLNLIVNLI